MRYLTLTERALFGNSARYVIQANRPVLTLDTFGGDEAWSVQSIAALVASGELRYAELPPGGPWEDARQPLGAWFTAHCQDLTPRGIVPLGGEGRLYECSP